MMKKWVERAVELLRHSTEPIPQELNELDWKESISPDTKKLSKHVSAFSNMPGGGFFVFGIEDHTAKSYWCEFNSSCRNCEKVR